MKNSSLFWVRFIGLGAISFGLLLLVQELYFNGRQGLIAIAAGCRDLRSASLADLIQFMPRFNMNTIGVAMVLGCIGALCYFGAIVYLRLAKYSDSDQASGAT